MVFEWVALVVAFCIFFGTIINKYIDHCDCNCCPNDEVQYEHLKTE